MKTSTTMNSNELTSIITLCAIAFKRLNVLIDTLSGTTSDKYADIARLVKVKFNIDTINWKTSKDINLHNRRFDLLSELCDFIDGGIVDDYNELKEIIPYINA